MAGGDAGAVAVLAGDRLERVVDRLGAAQVGVSGVHDPDEHHQRNVDCRKRGKKDGSQHAALRCPLIRLAEECGEELRKGATKLTSG